MMNKNTLLLSGLLCVSAVLSAGCGMITSSQMDEDETEVCAEADLCSEPAGLSFETTTRTAQYGNLLGGTAFEDPCPEDHAIIGYTGQISSEGWHGQIRAVCGSLTLIASQPLLVAVEPKFVTPVRGLLGTEQWTLLCPDHQVLVGFNGRHGLLMDQLGFFCAQLQVDQVGEGYKLSMSEPVHIGAAGSPDGGMSVPDTLCSPGDLATSSRVRAGDHVDAFGLGCSAPSLRPMDETSI